MKIAIIGAGISGNTLAYHLCRDHDISVFEAGGHVGGHTHTHDIQHGGEQVAVDTGFIVFNDRTYPNFIGLLDELGVDSQPSNMSFSVKCEKTGLEYNGTSPNALFAQRRNLLRPSFYRMIRDILRFNRESLELLAEGGEIGLGDYLTEGGYGRDFIDYYIIPMGSAVWSTDPRRMLAFPARFFVRFFHHHGMLSIDDRPQWHVIRGGSACYVEALTASFADRIRLNTPVAKVRRLTDSLGVTPLDGQEESFDWVFFACHSDQALRLLSDPSDQEREILGAIPYQENDLVLHSDARLLPRRKLAWAAWNYHVTPAPIGRVTVTYNLNILQGLDTDEPLLVTLNHTGGIAEEKIIKRLTYHHPVYTAAGAAAQLRHAEISGVNRTGYCGAYWRNGFHEDGIVSALTALEHFRHA
ncbi:MAG: NAD(P)/FAD-dependent oxidoreductase [Methylococcales bacterium]